MSFIPSPPSAASSLFSAAESIPFCISSPLLSCRSWKKSVPPIRSAAAACCFPFILKFSGFRHSVPPSARRRAENRRALPTTFLLSVLPSTMWKKIICSPSLWRIWLLCAISPPPQFRRGFRGVMGGSPPDFINNPRINKACNLLRSTEHSILSISEMAGFHSLSSFNRSFSKIMQQAPRDYRKMMAQSDQLAQSQSIQEYTGWMHPE